MDLKAEQQRLFALMPPGARCFVRISGRDDSLWVSDLPRRGEDCDETAERLYQAGYETRLDPDSCLWMIDWRMERWQEMIGKLPCECPALPADEKWHEAYALCRLWMMHPSPLSKEHLPVLRRVVKLTAQPKEKGLQAVRAMHEEAAVQLRSGKSIAHAAGQVLAAWLLEQTNGKESRT